MDIGDVSEYVDRAAAIAGLEIAPEHRAGVIEHLAGTLALAATIMEFPLDDDVEPAPVFRP
jgi:Protein of unknown function (DUF4089)